MAKRVIHWEMGNEPQTVEIGGTIYRFKSKAEYKWARYLDKLYDLGAIDYWEYEPTTFEFGERWRKRRVYTPDFLVKEDGQEIYHEVKTGLQQKDITRFRCLRADFPEVRIILVIVGRVKTKSAKQNRLRANAQKYIERIVFANPLLKEFGIK